MRQSAVPIGQIHRNARFPPKTVADKRIVDRIRSITVVIAAALGCGCAAPPPASPAPASSVTAAAPLGAIDAGAADSARDRAMAACVACNGVWAREGIRDLEGCNCRPNDAGKVCHDGAECEGVCLADGVEVITPPEPLVCDAGQCSAAMGAERLVGHCSDRKVVYGCHPEILRGASKTPPSPPPVRASSICVD